MESRFPQPKFPSPMQSAASKGEQVPPPPKQETLKMQEVAEQAMVVKAPQQTLQIGSTAKVVEFPEVTHESKSMKEPASQGSAPLDDDEVQQQKPVSSEAGK